MTDQYTPEEDIDINALNKQIHADINSFGDRITACFKRITGIEYPGDNSEYGNDYIEILHHLHEMQHTLYAVEMQRDFIARSEDLPWDSDEKTKVDNEEAKPNIDQRSELSETKFNNEYYGNFVSDEADRDVIEYMMKHYSEKYKERQ